MAKYELEGLRWSSPEREQEWAMVRARRACRKGWGERAQGDELQHQGLLFHGRARASTDLTRLWR
jgi:hypothetical protein